MARTSGRVQGVPAGEFRHAPSGVRYRVGADGTVAAPDGVRLLPIAAETIALTPIALGGNPNPGEFAISVALNNIRFQPPAGITAGVYFVRLRVRGVEGPPVERITLP